MNRSEMIDIIATKTGNTRKDIEKMLQALNEATTEALTSGDKVAFSGFGSFEVRTRAAHMGRDPRTGNPLEIPETKTVAFRPGKILKTSVAK
jgi:DNA-binding protein HU-beta